MHYQCRHRGRHEKAVRKQDDRDFMCGIAGWLLDDPRRYGAAELQRMLKAIRHRGPDDTGIHIAEEHWPCARAQSAQHH